MMQMWNQHQQIQHPSGMHHQQMQMPQSLVMTSGDQARRRKLPTLAKSHPPPEGFYCYYPEIFDKPHATIFQVIKVPRQPAKAVVQP